MCQHLLPTRDKQVMDKQVMDLTSDSLIQATDVYYMTGIVLVAGNIVVNKWVKNLYPRGYSSEKDNKKPMETKKR